MKTKKTAGILCFLVLAGVLAGFFLLREKKNPSSIVASGNIEVTDVSLGFKISGRLAQCLKDEGDA
ncbi:MAG: hypothetical protein AB1Z81_10650, partial [Desulfotignum sp.]